MTSYMIFTRRSTTDQSELDRYNDTAPASAAGFVMTPLAFYGAHEVLEGSSAEGVVVLQFPTVAEARRWYDSPAYQAAATHRRAGSEYDVVIVEGLS